MPHQEEKLPCRCEGTELIHKGENIFLNGKAYIEKTSFHKMSQDSILNP